MYIIIAGAGRVGYGLTKVLMNTKHDVVVIDKNTQICDEITASLGVVTINGNCTNINVLKEAGIRKCDISLALMSSDADNIAFITVAKSFGVKELIVRMKDPDYEAAYKSAGVTKIARMADLLISELIMDIEKPPLRRILSLCNGKAELSMVNIPIKARAAGKTIQEIANDKNFPSDCLITGIVNKNASDLIVPRGRQIINEEDSIFIVAKTEDAKRASMYLLET